MDTASLLEELKKHQDLEYKQFHSQFRCQYRFNRRAHADTGTDCKNTSERKSNILP